MRKKGKSVIVRDEQQFNILKFHLGFKALYMDWVPQMATNETGVIVECNKNSDFSVGSVGSTEYQKREGFEIIEFKDYE